ncbi:GHKL domain-containing protein [Anaerocolumna aminovalerica]|uniref:sensor histidine kinase n=1 Tax=Anaerocolumna aminovalerica TaxID=1527 RepID=UPI001C0EA199|nr:GHKL domain-containing protein [Anaerocolumna aminovalerica]MBU5331142.1 GHKL domain-containing protein [Anaerocolumna aminovalerica]
MSKAITEILLLMVLGISLLVGMCINIKLTMQRTKLMNIIGEYERKEKESENFKLYTETIENMVVEYRKFSHDSKNMMATLIGYIDNEDFIGLKEFYKNEILQETKTLVHFDISYLNYIKNPALKGLVITKALEAQKQGIHFKINVLQDIENMYMKNLDICRITGILLDNAIEAALLSKEKIVNFGIIEDSEEIYLIVSNSFAEKPVMSQIYTEGYSTKGKNRGMGLNILKSIIHNNINVLSNTLIEGNLFMQEIIIQKEMS